MSISRDFIDLYSPKSRFPAPTRGARQVRCLAPLKPSSTTLVFGFFSPKNTFAQVAASFAPDASLRAHQRIMKIV